MKQEEQILMKALYDAAPYPEVLEGKMAQTNPLLTHWVNAASPKNHVLSNHSTILVAGCGSGAEVFMLAQLYPKAKIVGIDFSSRSIARATAKLAQSNFPHVSFATEDLMDENWLNNYPPFDFILCHGVADYVALPERMLLHFSQLLSTDGVLCMTVNSPHHPAGSIRQAFQQLGIHSKDYQDTELQRMYLQVMDQLMGEHASIRGIGNAPKAYLDVDIFPPIAHHFSLDAWCKLAKHVGLQFYGSMDAPLGLGKLNKEQMPLLYNMGKAKLSHWMTTLEKRAGIQMLFGQQNLKEPNFSTLESLGGWTPLLASCVGQLPSLQGDPDAPKTLTLRFQGLPDFVIYSSAYDLEILRHCDGKKSIASIQEATDAEGDRASLLAVLYRAYQFGLLS